MRKTSINSTETRTHHNSRMRLWWIIAIIVLFAFDHAFLDGRIADHVWSLVQSLGMSIKYRAHDLLQPLRR